MRCRGIGGLAVLACALAGGCGGEPMSGDTADPWARLVERARVDAAAVVAALGKPVLEYQPFVKEGERPLQVNPNVPPPPEEGEDFGPWRPLRALEYGEAARRLAYQVVLDESLRRVAWAVAPPLEGERSLSEVRKKYGEADVHPVGRIDADVIYGWAVIRYPARGREFVLAEDGERVLARVLFPPERPR